MKLFKLFTTAMMTMVAFSAFAKTYGYLYCHMSDRGEWTAYAISY